jgi:hypothetical protein
MSSGLVRELDNDGYFKESILPLKDAMSNVELLYKMMLTLAFKRGIFPQQPAVSCSSGSWNSLRLCAQRLA